MVRKRIVLVCALLIFFTGCGLTSEQRVEMLERAVVRAEEVSEELGIRLEEMETTLVETQTALSDPNLPAEFREQLDGILTQTVEGIKVISAKRGEYAGLISRLRKQIEDAKTGDMNFGDELKLYGEGLKTIGPKVPPPVGGFVTLAGIVIGTIGTVLAKRRGGELTDVVKSVDVLLESSAVHDTTAATKVLKDHQSPNTRTAVRKVKNKG